MRDGRGGWDVTSGMKRHGCCCLIKTHDAMSTLCTRSNVCEGYACWKLHRISPGVENIFMIPTRGIARFPHEYVAFKRFKSCVGRIQRRGMPSVKGFNEGHGRNRLQRLALPDHKDPKVPEAFPVDVEHS